MAIEIFLCYTIWVKNIGEFAQSREVIMKKTDEKYVVRPAVSLLINSSKAGSIVNSLDISALISPKKGFKISSN